jgi:hypothetical protein
VSVGVGEVSRTARNPNISEMGKVLSVCTVLCYVWYSNVSRHIVVHGNVSRLSRHILTSVHSTVKRRVVKAGRGVKRSAQR